MTAYADDNKHVEKSFFTILRYNKIDPFSKKLCCFQKMVISETMTQAVFWTVWASEKDSYKLLESYTTQKKVWPCSFFDLHV